ncbi:hypothetical protein ACFO5O_14065 [Geojedonia litorea]|uniref:Selenophosphate synthetase n=1 Tax=Geojedonia litorea TaxID=1268269 RepID=A0ABV9N541_9FLAO
MKQASILLFLLVVIFSCKESNKSETIEPEKELTTAQKIAIAHGFEHWKHVTQIDFTFNVDRDSSHFERTWSWQPKSNDVSLITSTDTISYNRKTMDSIAMKSDRGFINDKYWFLAPYQLIWDKSATISEPTKANAPISATELNKITMTYPNEGGYTPGDAYDFYFGDDYLIKEWVFRKANNPEPSLISTWENYQNVEGLILALDHKKQEGNWKLYFTNVKVKTNTMP